MKLIHGAYVLLSYAVEVFYHHEKKHEWRKQLAVLMLHLHLSKHELLAPVRMHALATVAAAYATIAAAASGRRPTPTNSSPLSLPRCAVSASLTRSWPPLHSWTYPPRSSSFKSCGYRIILSCCLQVRGSARQISKGRAAALHAASHKQPTLFPCLLSARSHATRGSTPAGIPRRAGTAGPRQCLCQGEAQGRTSGQARRRRSPGEGMESRSCGRCRHEGERGSTVAYSPFAAARSSRQSQRRTAIYHTPPRTQAQTFFLFKRPIISRCRACTRVHAGGGFRRRCRRRGCQIRP